MINKNKAVQRSCKVYKLSLFVIFLFTSLEFSPFNRCYYVQYTAITVPGISQKNICNIKSFDGWLILTERNHLNFLPLQPIKSCFKKTSPQFCPITTRKAGSGRRRHVEQTVCLEFDHTETADGQFFQKRKGRMTRATEKQRNWDISRGTFTWRFQNILFFSWQRWADNNIDMF